MFSKNKKILTALILLPSIGILISVLAAPVFNPDLQPVGYIGQPAASSTIITSGNESLYAIDYSSQDWSGDLHNYTLSNSGAISTTDNWGGGAATQIDLQDFNTGRNIVTWNGSAGIPFRWSGTSSLSSTQKTALDSATAATSATSSPILDYIRGDTSNQNPNGLKYRARSHVLGDIIHSTPVYLNDGTNKTVFVGANDGMLHAINATDGTERFAYIPSVLIPKLALLTNTSYAHKYYVDGRLTIGKVGTKSILVGTLGAGGNGLFGLDVTNANATSETNAASKILWEITNSTTDFANLGYSYSAPTLLTLPSAVSALVVGNGYNNTGNGHASLFIINPETGALIHESDTGSGSTSSPNGLSSPSFSKGFAYAGDIDGHLWKFDLTSPYAVTLLHTTGDTSANPSEAPQAITMAPGIKEHPEGGVMLTFVTGRMLNTADTTDTANHYAYGIWDGAPALNDTLLSQTLTESTYTSVTPSVRIRTATSNVPDWSSGAGHHKGWKTKLPIGGERIVGDGAFVTGNVFLFMTTNPTISPTATPPGENWWMQLNALTGGDSGTVLFDLNKDGLFNSTDQTTTGLNPVGRYMGGGVRSQLMAFSAAGFDVYQSNYDKNGNPPPVTTTTTGSRGVSGGHFDFDIYCYTNCKTTTGATSGKYYTGTDTKGGTNGLNYAHVHEYDDIYDVTGVDMLNPSQTLDKLSRVTVSATVSSTSTTTTGPTAVDGTITTVSTSTTTGYTSNTWSKPSSTLVTINSTVKTTATPLNGYPLTTTSGTSTTITTKTVFETTQSSSQNVNITGTNKKWKYDIQTTIKKWTTTTTSTVTTTPTTKTAVVPLPNTTGFKVLVSNQAYSPAAKISIGGADYVNAYGYQAISGLTVASFPSYTLASIGSLKFNLPLDGFKSRDWGTGIVRAGLHPAKASCVYADGILGPNGEWRNGALTFQVVYDTITDSDIQLNVAGHPELGYRLKNTSMASKLIAEYTTFWHHPNDKCMADSGWTMSPPEDPNSDATSATPASGSTDPKEGIFGVSSTNTGASVGTVTTNVTNPDGSVTKTVAVTVGNADGTTTTTTTSTTTGISTGIETGGVVNTTGGINSDGTDTRKQTAVVGRINWRELQQ